MSIKVSIIVPVYGVEKYLNECVDSLLAQSLEETEIILVNDCSPDNSLSIMWEYEKRYPDKIRVIDSPENLKQGGARNLGIKIARGEFIGFVDSDDVVDSQMFAKLYGACIDNNADAAYSEYYSFKDGDDNNKSAKDSDDLTAHKYEASLVSKYNCRDLTVGDKQDLMCVLQTPVWSGIYKREIITENNLFFPEHLIYEDNSWVTLGKIYLNKIVFVQEALYYYRERKGSAVHSFNNKGLFDRITIEQMLQDEIRARGMFEDYKAALEYIFIYRATFQTVKALALRFDPLPKKEIKNILKELKRRYPQWKRNPYYKKVTRGGGPREKRTRLSFPGLAVSRGATY